jgi:organic hydroperoxide reductase OsmC/OhrA
MPTTRPRTHEHTAAIAWQRGEHTFADGRFSRAHTWTFDGGITVPASAAPSVVRAPYSVAEAVDPEEALVASVSSCHMMTFLFLAAKEGLRVDDYRDDATGLLTPNTDGKRHISKITLTPHITFSGGKKPSSADIARLHHAAHDGCYIANSILAEVVVAEVAPVFA